LPRLRIEGAQIAGKILFEEHPGTADFRTRDFAYLQ